MIGAVTRTFPRIVAFLKDAADPWAKWATVAAVVVGGAWAWWNFELTDTSTTNAQLGVSVEVMPYDHDDRLLVVHLQPNNIGKIAIEVKGDGLSIAIKALPLDAKPGRIMLERLKVAYSAQHIERKYGGYVLEPGVKFNETEAFIVPTGNIYFVVADMDLGDDWSVGNSTIVSVK